MYIKLVWKKNYIMLDGFDINKSNFSRPKCLLYIVSSESLFTLQYLSSAWKNTDFFISESDSIRYIHQYWWYPHYLDYTITWPRPLLCCGTI